MEHAQVLALQCGKKKIARNTRPLLLSDWSVTSLFYKVFHYTSSFRPLPIPKELFSEYYQFDGLQDLKKQLNEVKCRLNNYDIAEWSLHTRRRDPSTMIPWHLKTEIKAEFVTVAWCKLFECLKQFPLVKSPKLNSLHLCEAPGAFISALNHYMYSTFNRHEVSWNWLATTLNLYYEGNSQSNTIIDDRFIQHTFDHWIFYEDFTGNIIDPRNIDQLEKICAERFRGGVDFITADGSVDCIDMPDYQEENVGQLHFAEITAALHILKDGGSFVLKLFTLFAATTVSKMYLLHCVFREVHVFKPITSKRGNSEVYVICLEYKRKTDNLREILQLLKEKLTTNNVLPMFAKAHIPSVFVMQHEVCARLFMNFQIRAIETNIHTFSTGTRHEVRRDHELRIKVKSHFMKLYEIKPIPQELKILHNHTNTIKVINRSHCAIQKGSYAGREAQKLATTEQRAFTIQGTLNDVERSLRCTSGVMLKQDSKPHAKHSTTKFKVCRGKPYSTLKVSMFASTNVMYLRQQIIDIFSTDPLWHDTPVCTIVDGYEVELNSLNENYSERQQQFFVQIVNGILEHKPREVVFTNVTFLTHYSVSLLRYLIDKLFHCFTITTSPSFAIILQATHTDYSAQILDVLIELRNILQEDIGVLCVLELEAMHHNDFSKALVNYNDMLLLKNFKLVLSI